jgi:hypothetical protein
MAQCSWAFDRVHECGPPLCIRRVDVGAGVDEDVDRGRIIAPGGDYKNGTAVGTALVGGSAPWSINSRRAAGA